jgi:ATP synthase protein I
MQDRPTQPPKKKQSPTDFLKYSAMGLQMVAIMGVFIFAGHWLDDFLEFKKVPIFTLILSLVGVAVALWYFIRDFLKKK